MIRKLLLFQLVLFCAISITLFAGKTGKISGIVTDSQTGEPIPGINVMVDGTTMGAATNIEGEYIIVNVPPGNYNVSATGVGFTKKTYTNVKVSSDFTTNLNFELSTDVIAVETVVVQAEAPLVRKDLTSSRVAVDADQIESLPVESINQILTLQAGIIQGAGGELHIRGGRSNEIAYTLNGVSISNPFNSSTRTVSVATNAIQELSVVSGTFNAEYGNALSGIVNTVTKEGSNNYRANITVYGGDYLSTRDETFYNIDDIDPINNRTVEMTLSGPVPLVENYLTFFFSGRFVEDGGYLYGIRQHNPTDSVYKNPLNPNDIRVAMTGDGKNVSMNSSRSLSSTAKLTFRPASTIKINGDVVYSRGWWQNYNHEYKYNPDANYNNYEWGLLTSLEVRHALSNRTFYSVIGSYNINDYKQYLYPLVNAAGNSVTFYPGRDLTGLRPDPRYQPEHKDVKAAEYTFASGGTLNNHYYQRSYTTGFKFDLTSQITNQHEIKFGGELRSHTLDYENFEILRDSTRYLEPTIPSLTTAKHDKYTKEPLEISAFIQDKMEFTNLIVNVGLRYDYFDANSQHSTDIFYPSPNDPNLPTYIDPNSLLTNSDPKHQLSPRIGISFPITDRGIIHFSYGHFFQMPPFQYLYANPDFKYSFDIGTPLIGNADLNPEKTITYELGLQQQLSENVAFNVTGYYKDVRDLLALQQIRVAGDKTYLKYVNKDYGNIKGITFSLTKRRTANDLLGATLDYTFQVAEGNETGADAFFLDLSSGRQSEKIPVFLNWDQTHTLNATVSVGEMGNWNISIVGKFGTGLPYSPVIFDNQVYLRPNSARRPSQATVDLLAEKSFGVFGFDLTLFLKIYNLFDTLNERFIYEDTGRATYTLIQTRGTAKAADEIAARVDGIHPSSEYFNRPNYYQPPREVRLGIEVDL